MPRLQHLLDHFCGVRYLARVRNGKEDLFHRIIAGEISRYVIRDEHGVARDFGLAKGLNSLTERADNHERKAVDLDVFSHGRALALINALRKLLRHRRNMRP